MLDNGIETELLKEFGKRLVMRKEEIIKFLKGRVSDPHYMAKILIQSLIQRGLITYIYSGSSSYAITKTGMRIVGKV